MKITNDFVDVSHSMGIPAGAIGTGYFMYGKYGFIMPNFDSYPDKNRYLPLKHPLAYDYIEPHDDERTSFMAISLSDGDRKIFLQEHDTGWLGVPTADEIKSYVYLPFGVHKIKSGYFGINAEMEIFAHMKPQDLKSSAIPAVCIRLTVENTESTARDIDVAFEINKFANLNNEKGNIAYVVENGGKLHIEAGESAQLKLTFAWYYPDVTTSSPFLTDDFTRYYTLFYKNSQEIAELAMTNFDEWEQDIIDWHNSIDVPPQFKRMWFSSLSSVIASTILTSDPLFFEIESPHPWVNTMDVCIYSSWLYMINWPEIEEMDMRLFDSHIPKDGDDKGFVWHSLWTDKTHYVEEPTFIVRAYRDYLWLNDDKFLEDLYPNLKSSFERVYTEVTDGLIESKDGNQSYDVWKMPGYNSYVNVVWIYAIYAMKVISEKLGKTTVLCGKELDEHLKKALDSFDKYLWNGKYYNCFYRTPGSRDVNVPESVFTDAMFGRWVMAIEKGMPEILPEDKIEATVRYAYKNNYVDDPKHTFKGWANGMLDGGIPLDGHDRQYHVKTCWLGAQLDLASLLAEYGDDDAFADVFDCIEYSLHNNHLAVGEWNYSIFPDKAAFTLPEEPCKDTPRFPPYPRYKSSWEHLIRMLGLKLSSDEIELMPLKNIDFSIKDVALAGCKLSVSVKKNWNKILINGKEADKAVLDRDVSEYTVSFE